MIASRFFREFQRFDWLLLLATFVLFAFGLAAIYSVELSRETLEFALVKKHAAIFLVSTVVMIVIANFNHLFLRSWGRALYLVGVALMVLVLFFGTELNGTTGWFIVAGVSFQPVEFMKVALAVQLARYFGEHARRRFGWKEIFGSGFLVAAPTVLTIAQPDLGSAILLIGMWMIVMFFAGLRVHHAVIITFAGALLGWVAWMFALADYQRLRLQVFLDPTLDPLGSGYNIAQAKIAIGSGQLFGRGLGFGSQSQLQFLPESQTDFIFAVIAEELGFIGVMVVILTLFFVRGSFGMMFGIAFGLTMFMAAKKMGPDMNRGLLFTLGLVSVLYAILDIKSDVLDRPGIQSDAAMLSDLIHIPTTLIGLIWISVAVGVAGFLLKQAYDDA